MGWRQCSEDFRHSSQYSLPSPPHIPDKQLSASPHSQRNLSSTLSSPDQSSQSWAPVQLQINSNPFWLLLSHILEFCSQTSYSHTSLPLPYPEPTCWNYYFSISSLNSLEWSLQIYHRTSQSLSTMKRRVDSQGQNTRRNWTQSKSSSTQLFSSTASSCSSKTVMTLKRMHPIVLHFQGGYSTLNPQAPRHWLPGLPLQPLCMLRSLYLVTHSLNM